MLDFLHVIIHQLHQIICEKGYYVCYATYLLCSLQSNETLLLSVYESNFMTIDLRNSNGGSLEIYNYKNGLGLHDRIIFVPIMVYVNFIKVIIMLLLMHKTQIIYK